MSGLRTPLVSFYTNQIIEFPWKYSLTITNRGKEASTGDCYLQINEICKRLETNDPESVAVFTICNHGDGGRNHIHGMYSGLLGSRAVQGNLSGGFSTVKPFNKSWIEYVRVQSLGEDYTIKYGV